MVRIREYYREENTPKADDVLPTAFAAVRDGRGQLLLVRRFDDGNWELPGGRIEPGESAVEAVIREVAEESGIELEVTGVAGVYSDPSHVLVRRRRPPAARTLLPRRTQIARRRLPTAAGRHRDRRRGLVPPCPPR
jgi:8-oxo-dGTP pyrophosphatase MutT (NUDIX family)